MEKGGNASEATKARYKEYIEKQAPKSKTFAYCVKAFAVGGLFCCIGQLISDCGRLCLGLNEADCSAFTAMIMVFIGCTLTALGLYDKLGKFAGAGSVVPITGFANSITAPAIEFRSEGVVMGVCAKMFTIAGPVLVTGYGTSILVGLVYYFFL